MNNLQKYFKFRFQHNMLVFLRKEAQHIVIVWYGTKALREAQTQILQFEVQRGAKIFCETRSWRWFFTRWQAQKFGKWEVPGRGADWIIGWGKSKIDEISRVAQVEGFRLLTPE